MSFTNLINQLYVWNYGLSKQWNAITSMQDYRPTFPLSLSYRLRTLYKTTVTSKWFDYPDCKNVQRIKYTDQKNAKSPFPDLEKYQFNRMITFWGSIPANFGPFLRSINKTQLKLLEVFNQAQVLCKPRSSNLAQTCAYIFYIPMRVFTKMREGLWLSFEYSC